MPFNTMKAHRGKNLLFSSRKQPWPSSQHLRSASLAPSPILITGATTARGNAPANIAPMSSAVWRQAPKFLGGFAGRADSIDVRTLETCPR